MALRPLFSCLVVLEIVPRMATLIVLHSPSREVCLATNFGSLGKTVYRVVRGSLAGLDAADISTRCGNHLDRKSSSIENGQLVRGWKSGAFPKLYKGERKCKTDPNSAKGSSLASSKTLHHISHFRQSVPDGDIHWSLFGGAGCQL